AKGSLGWIDRDNVYLYTDFGPGTTSSSGYPLVVKQWRRGTPMSAAAVVYEGKPDDMSISAWRDHAPGFARDFVSRAIEFYNDELYLRDGDALRRVDAPNSASKRVHREWLTLELRDPWTAEGRTYAAGSLLATRLDEIGRASCRESECG